LAKRFTDSDKWKKRWFRKLNNNEKVFWMYLLDQCDHAGIWEVDFELAAYFCGELSDYEIKNTFSKQFIEFDDGKRWFVKDFIEFQYGILNPNVNAHRSAIMRLKKYNLLKYVDNEDSLNELLMNSSFRVKDKNKDKYMDKVRVKDKEKSKETQLEKIDIDVLITKFPNIEVKAEFEKWQDWMLSKGKTFKNYNSSFKNWLRNDWVARKADSDAAQKRKLICPIHERQITFTERDTIKYCPYILDNGKECRQLMKSESELALIKIQDNDQQRERK